MKFTDMKIKNLKPGSKRYIEWEGHGLGIRVSPKGRKSWIFAYRFEGRPRMMTIGTYPDKSLAKARAALGKALSDLEDGSDPGAKKVEENEFNRASPTVKELKLEYIKKWAKAHKRTWKEDERMLEKDVLPGWGKRKAKDISRRDVIRLLDGIVDRGSPIVANRTLEIIRKMFNFAIEQDIIQASPCVMVRAPGKEAQRDRVLSQDEIKIFWNSLGRSGNDSLRMSQGTKLAFKLLLLTAQRRGEVATAKISEFDFNSGWWTIPPDKSKNGLSHRVPLSPRALDIIKTAAGLAGDSPFLFPSPRKGKTPEEAKSITAGSLTRALGKCRSEITGEHFTCHDLRRTAASLMTGIGISRLVVSKILNHAETSVTSIYDRHSYDEEKRAALYRWAEKLEEITKVKAVPRKNL